MNIANIFAPILFNPKKLIMKKLFILTAIAALTFTSLESKAQAFNASTKLITLAIGPGEMIHFPVGNNNPLVNNGFGGYNFNRAILTGQFSIQGEFAVHKYVGVGFAIGVGGRTAVTTTGSIFGVTSWGYYKEVNVPIAVLANFHFYQLIADKKGGNLHADKLDVYAGITAGSGVAIHPYKDNNTGATNFNDALFYFGPHAGVNYYFTDMVGVHGEVGWGVTLLQAGITFKLGGK